MLCISCDCVSKNGEHHHYIDYCMCTSIGQKELFQVLALTCALGLPYTVILPQNKPQPWRCLTSQNFGLFVLSKALERFGTEVIKSDHQGPWLLQTWTVETSELPQFANFGTATSFKAFKINSWGRISAVNLGLVSSLDCAFRLSIQHHHLHHLVVTSINTL